MPWLVAFATVYGLTRGAQSFVTSLAWADYFGREAQGAIRGLASPFRHLSAAAGPIVGGVLYDITGDYRLAFAIFAAAFVADRESTRLNSRHVRISYAVFCFKKKNKRSPCTLYTGS